MTWRIALLSVVSAAALAGCQTPCGRVASAICTIPGEESSCRFLRDVPSGNDTAQEACTKARDVADAYAAEPDSTVQKLKWTATSGLLRAAGLVGDVTKSGSEAAGEVRAAAAKAADAARDVVKDAEGAAKGIGEALEGKKQ